MNIRNVTLKYTECHIRLYKMLHYIKIYKCYIKSKEQNVTFKYTECYIEVCRMPYYIVPDATLYQNLQVLHTNLRNISLKLQNECICIIFQICKNASVTLVKMAANVWISCLMLNVNVLLVSSENSVTKVKKKPFSMTITVVTFVR